MPIRCARCPFALFALLLIMLAGCGGSGDTPPEDGQPATGESAAKFTIGMSQCNLDEPWRVQMDKDIETAAAEHPDINVVFKDAGGDASKQQADVDQFVVDGVDLIIVSPIDAVELAQPIARAFDAGIPVILLDRAVLGGKYTCFIGNDNRKIGQAAGEWLAKQFDDRVNIVELKGPASTARWQDRHEGFREMLHDPRFSVILEFDMKTLGPNAREDMETALERFDDIDAVYAHNDAAAHAAYQAAKEAGREKEIVFIGIDALPDEGRSYVKQGMLDASLEYPTGGKEAIDMAVKILAGEEVPKNVTLGSRLFTQENVEQGGEPIE